jgi:BolA family transcriptional regulator, general stress-responsive regulator
MPQKSSIDAIKTKLTETFSPLYLYVEDESHLHKGHAGYSSQGESHFHVTLSSVSFKDVPRIKRHQMVYACLENELKNGVHALSLTLLTPEEWEELREQE